MPNSPMLVPLATEALYDALLKNGYVHNKADFGRMLEICPGNVYNYLPSKDGDRQTRPFRPTLETVRRWVSMIQEQTGLYVRILLNDGPVGFEVTGKSANGQQFAKPMLYQVVEAAKSTEEQDSVESCSTEAAESDA